MDSGLDIVCVTGGTGFIASHIVAMLLEEGFAVNATVRSAKDSSKLEYLRKYDKHDRLKFFEANLTDEGSFDTAVQGCKYVLHTASPYTLNAADPKKDLVDPALQGTLTVLNSCAKSPSVKRVVLTSSVAAISDSGKKDHIYTEEDWNTESSLTRNPYYYSKKLAEEAAWKFMKETNVTFELVVINPFIVIGPELNPSSVNTSNQLFADLFHGKYPGILDLNWGMVDVRDVARSHVLAMKNHEATGRFICCAGNRTMEHVIKLLSSKYPHATLPCLNMSGGAGNFVVKLASHFQDAGTGSYLRTNIGKPILSDNSKIRRELGIEFRNLDDSILDTVADLMTRGFIKQKAT